jgi:hypothetical protein
VPIDSLVRLSHSQVGPSNQSLRMAEAEYVVHVSRRSTKRLTASESIWCG